MVDLRVALREVAIVNPPDLSIDEQRELVYASLLRYTSETATLRERVLDRVVLGGLIGSSVDSPYRVGSIVSNLRLGENALTIRPETVQESLERLRTNEKIDRTVVRKGVAFYLREAGEEELLSVVSSSSADFREALGRMLKDTAHLVDFELASQICRNCILECFARFGRTIARTVTGRANPEDLPRLINTDAAFKAALGHNQLTAEAIESLKARCHSFLRSSDQRDFRVKFHLTQSYYFAQLLGFEDSVFNPLRDHVFANATIYLDTNVVIVGVLEVAEDVPILDELSRLTKRLGLSLAVTRATINEACRVSEKKVSELNRIAKLPTHLIECTDDHFVLAYLAAREKRPDVRAEEVVAPFGDLEELFTKKWNVSLDDRVEEDVLIDGRVGDVCKIIDEEAVKIRRGGKSLLVQRHDALHYYIIRNLRSAGGKAWFLSRDRTLLGAAARLAGPTEPQFCIGLIGFLHSISPFITTPEEEDTLATVLGHLVADQVFDVGPVFEAAELALLAEFHEDVVATPPDQLLLALDFIKSTTLQGLPYSEADIPRVSLELRKFLSSSKDEQNRALQTDRARLAGLAETESQRRIEAERTVASLRSQEQYNAGQLAQAEEEARQARSKAHIAQVWLRGLIMVIGVSAGTLLWSYSHTLALAILLQFPPLLDIVSPQTGSVLLNGLGAALAALPTYVLVMALALRAECKIALLAIGGAIILGLSNVLSSARLSFWANTLGVAAPLAALAVGAWHIWANRRDRKGQSKG